MQTKKFKLLEIATISNKRVKKFEGERHYVATGDIDQTQIVSGDYVTYDNRPSRADLILGNGDVLFAKMKNTVKVLEGLPEYEDKIFSTGFYVLTPNNNVSGKYLYFYFLTNHFNQQKDAYSTGATMAAITNVGLGKLKITLPVDSKGNPDIKEQERLVVLFEEAEELKRKRAEADQKMEKVIPALFNQMFGDPHLNNMNWVNSTLGDVMEIITDYHANGSYKVLKKNVQLLNQKDYALMLRAMNFEHENYTSNLKYISYDAYNFLKKSQLHGGEIIINKIGNAGNVYLMPQLGVPCSLAMNQFAIRLKDDINPVFMYHLLKTDYSRSQLLSKVQGAVTKTITKDAVRSIPIFIPPTDLQNKFADKVKTILSLKQTQKESSEKIEQLFLSTLTKVI